MHSGLTEFEFFNANCIYQALGVKIVKDNSKTTHTVLMASLLVVTLFQAKYTQQQTGVKWQVIKRYSDAT